MKELDRELFLGWPDTAYVLRVLLRLGVAAVLGGVIGLERERTGKAAGMRTHMLVCLGAALFTTLPLEIGMDSAGLTRVIQGVVAGIGFLGGGAILKLSDQHEVRGLTTAAGIWLTAAAGVAAGAGWLWPAVCGIGLAWVILRFLHVLDRRIRPPDEPGGRHQD